MVNRPDRPEYNKMDEAIQLDNLRRDVELGLITGLECDALRHFGSKAAAQIINEISPIPVPVPTAPRMSSSFQRWFEELLRYEQDPEAAPYVREIYARSLVSFLRKVGQSLKATGGYAIDSAHAVLDGIEEWLHAETDEQRTAIREKVDRAGSVVYRMMETCENAIKVADNPTSVDRFAFYLSAIVEAEFFVREGTRYDALAYQIVPNMVKIYADSKGLTERQAVTELHQMVCDDMRRIILEEEQTPRLDQWEARFDDPTE